MFAFDNGESADTRPDKNACPFAQLRRDHQSGLLHRAVGCCDCVMDKGIHFLYIFLFEPMKRIEVFNFGGDSGGKLGGIESCDCRDATARFAKAFPCLFSSRAQRRYKTNARNNDSSLLQNKTS